MSRVALTGPDQCLPVVERCAGFVTSGVCVHTRVHIPNILKDKRNRFKGVIGEEESVIQINRKTL